MKFWELKDQELSVYQAAMRLEPDARKQMLDWIAFRRRMPLLSWIVLKIAGVGCPIADIYLQ